MVGSHEDWHILIWKKGFTPFIFTTTSRVACGLQAGVARALTPGFNAEKERTSIQRLRVDRKAFHADPRNAYSKADTDDLIDLTDAVADSKDAICGYGGITKEVVKAILEDAQ